MDPQISSSLHNVCLYFGQLPQVALTQLLTSAIFVTKSLQLRLEWTMTNYFGEEVIQTFLWRLRAKIIVGIIGCNSAEVTPASTSGLAQFSIWSGCTAMIKFSEDQECEVETSCEVHFNVLVYLAQSHWNRRQTVYISVWDPGTRNSSIPPIPPLFPLRILYVNQMMSCLSPYADLLAVLLTMC